MLTSSLSLLLPRDSTPFVDDILLSVSRFNPEVPRPFPGVLPTPAVPTTKPLRSASLACALMTALTLHPSSTDDTTVSKMTPHSLL